MQASRLEPAEYGMNMKSVTKGWQIFWICI